MNELISAIEGTLAAARKAAADGEVTDWAMYQRLIGAVHAWESVLDMARLINEPRPKIVNAEYGKWVN